MFNKQALLVSIGAVVAVGGMMASGHADAVQKIRLQRSNAANFCQSALPVFDSQIRKRPLAVQNEGSKSAFITCAFPELEIGTVKSVTTYVHSSAGNAGTVSCLGVLGQNPQDAESTPVIYTPKSIDVDGAGNGVPLGWYPADFGGSNVGGPLGLSCNLQPGAGIDTIVISYSEDVGS